jgi:hypothetical protein
VVEIGRHADLLARPGGVYAGLHEMQFNPKRHAAPAPGQKAQE